MSLIDRHEFEVSSGKYSVELHDDKLIGLYVKIGWEHPLYNHSIDADTNDIIITKHTSFDQNTLEIDWNAFANYFRIPFDYRLSECFPLDAREHTDRHLARLVKTIPFL